MSETCEWTTPPFNARPSRTGGGQGNGEKVAQGAPASAVTGGATGIGKAVVSGLVARGGHAVIVDVADDAAQRTVDEITAAGGKASYLACDMGETAAVGTPATDVEEEFGRIDFLHNNAFAGWKSWSLMMAGHFEQTANPDRSQPGGAFT